MIADVGNVVVLKKKAVAAYAGAVVLEKKAVVAHVGTVVCSGVLQVTNDEWVMTWYLGQDQSNHFLMKEKQSVFTHFYSVHTCLHICTYPYYMPGTFICARDPSSVE